jgi:hypothetical protein
MAMNHRANSIDTSPVTMGLFFLTLFSWSISVSM